MKRTIPPESLSTQMKRHANRPIKKEQQYDGNFGTVISTGSTLLDLAISGGRIKGGGLPGGILFEIFGPSGSGKTVLLSEIGGNVQRQGGEIKFYDPEARLNKQFAKLFGLEIEKENYKRPDTVTEVFKNIRSWSPESLTKKSKRNIVNGIFADSLAALSTDMEMDKEEGDKMGGRRAKEFSEQLRRTCRILANKNYLMGCSNQVRQNMNAGQFEEKYSTPGGVSMSFYSSLRLRTYKPEKIKVEKKIAGKKVFRVIGVETQIEVYKSTIGKPYHKVPVYILFDYGIDDIRGNLQFIKDHTKNDYYTCKGIVLSDSMIEAIHNIEDNNLINKLREETIDLWEEIESKFKQERKPKR